MFIDEFRLSCHTVPVLVNISVFNFRKFRYMSEFVYIFIPKHICVVIKVEWDEQATIMYAIGKGLNVDYESITT